MFTPKSILVPTDFSEEARLALDWAIMLARQTSEQKLLYLVHVISPVPEFVALDVAPTDYRAATQEWVMEQMAEIQKTLPPSVRSIPVCLTGRAAKEIVDLCGAKGVELIVMTTHGRKGFSHLLHGSVAEEIVRSAPCPVLVLHMNRNTLEPVHSTHNQQQPPTP